MRIVRYLKNSKIAVVLIVCLLIVQAFTDLSLPNYTSKIVDVGIQQSGVEHAATDEMTAKTHDLVAMMLPAADEQTFRDAYTETADGTYKLDDEGKKEIDELDRMVAMPLVAIHYSQQIPDLDLDQVMQAYQAGVVTKDQILDMLDEAKEKMGDMGDSIVDQQAIAAAKQEYESLGYNLSDLQMNYLVRIGLIMLGLAALGMVVAIAVGFIASRTAAKVGATLRGRLFRRVVSFSDAEVQSFSAASLITRGTNDIQLVQMVTVMLLRMVLYSPILAIGGIIMVSRTNLAMSWIIVLAVVIIFVLIMVLMKVAMPKFKIVQKLIDRVNLVSREILTGLPVIRAFDRQPYEEERFDAANEHLMKTQLFTNRVMTFMMPLMMLVMNGVSVLIVWVGGSYIDTGTIQTGDLIAFITYAMVIIMSFLMIGMISIMLPRADVAAQRVNEVLETEPTICDPEPSKARDAALADRAGGATIAFNDVSFKYGDSKECVLEDLSFTAEPGKTTALIGSTGSGKSTVIKLIERFYDVTEGSITLDGVDIRDLSQRALRAQLGYVPQKAFLFSGTIESNVAYSDEDMPAERVDQAIDIAQAADFVASKEEGLEADVSQGGTNVSGGQRQRLAIARALATEARAYLFDDSFSALDYKTDAALRQELHARLSDKTVVIVAQRISTILHADKIVVLDEGRIVGQGTHEELMQTCEEYREIAMSQLSEEELTGGDAA
ncbi:ABC transporter ATP-binding protein [Gordonibacter massiliensis (ex Traore et al. 2017)]|uniref:ABC transporter ATP-binding protein n=1 Tax=Gordonibacter massiliensis (ex Traore et al. 2017) TaxID=1841863 RepID=UPI001C8B1230|nr:ABC transporter ATP-binding protein [Gordonibacter massiliensis (ex Traore et al. 2017)]